MVLVPGSFVLEEGHLRGSASGFASLNGFAKSKERNVISVTKREWKANDKIKHDLYVVENLGIDGIIIWQESSGKIYESMPNCDVKLIAGSLAEYLKEK